MNKLLFLFAMGVGAARAIAAQESAAVLASRFRGLPLDQQTIEKLPKGREQEVLNALIDRQKVYAEVLLRLNHGPTVEKILVEFQAVQGKSVFLRRVIEQSGSPYIIDELAPALYKNDTVLVRYYGEHADWDYGEPAQTAEIIGQLIISAPEFSSNVKQWAKKNLGTPGPNIIQAARAWWELNRKSLLANQFGEVQIPASYVPVASPEQSLQQPAVAEPLTKEPIAPPPTNLSQELDKTAVAGSVSTTAPLREPVKKGKLLWWILGLALLAATAGKMHKGSGRV
jgi:hypothetical protein